MTLARAADVGPGAARGRRLERRVSILRAAALTFSHSGFSATSMDDIAAAAGVSKLIVYRHFDSKESLYRSILDDVSTRLGTEFAAAVDRSGIRGVPARVFLAVARDDPNAFRLLWRHSTREPQFSEYATAVHDVAVEVARGYLDTVIAEPALQTWAAHVLVAHLVDASLLWVEHGDAADDERVAALVARSTRALARAWGPPRTGET